MERGGALLLWNMWKIQMCSSVVSQAVPASPSGERQAEGKIACWYGDGKWAVRMCYRRNKLKIWAQFRILYPLGWGGGEIALLQMKT